MIVFKQKEYIAPLIAGAAGKVLGGVANTAMIGSSVAGVIQGHNANKANEEAAEQAAREQKRHNKAMEEAAKNNPNLANAVEERGFAESQKNYAFIPASVTKAAANLGKTKAGTFAKDMYGMYGGGLKSAAKMGAGFAAIGYAGNKIAQGIKRHDEGEDDKNKKTLAKAAGVAATLGAGVLAAKSGKLPGQLGPKAQQFMTTGAGGKALKSVSNQVLARNKAGKISVGGTLKNNAFNGIFLAMPTASYLMSKKGQKDQVAAQEQSQEQQQQYSENGEKKSSLAKKALLGVGTVGLAAGTIMGAKRGMLGTGAQRRVGNMLTRSGNYASKQGLAKTGTYLTSQGKTAVNAAQKAVETGNERTLANKITGGFNKAAGFFGMHGQTSGTAAVQERAAKMAGMKGDEHAWTNAVGRFMQNHKNVANVAGGVALAAAGTTAMGLGDKLVNKPLKKLDKGAYDMENQEKQIVASEIQRDTISFVPKNREN